MDLSVVIPTLNRADSLRRTLESLTDQSVEIIVVDNGSTDDTASVIKQFRLRHILETEKGASNAKNRGTREASGRWIAFLDDDATVEPGWADAVREAIRSNPDAIGGSIIVEWPGAKPSWMPREREGYYGHCDFGNEVRELKFPEYPFGSNMILRRELLQQIGGLSPKVGPTAGDMMSGGEQEMFYRLSQIKARVMYTPGAVVHHWIPSHHATKKWLIHRAYKHGVSNARTFNPAAGKATARCFAGCVAALCARNENDRISRAATAAYWAGVALEAWRGWTDPKIPPYQQHEFSEALGHLERKT